MNGKHCSAQSVGVHVPAPLEVPGTQGETGREKWSMAAPRTLSHLIKASKRAGFSCLLGTAHPSPMSFCSSLLSQRQVVYWEADPPCWVAAMPVQSLPDFQSFFPWFSQPSISLYSSKQTETVFVSLFQTGRRKEKQKAITAACCSAGLITH